MIRLFSGVIRPADLFRHELFVHLPQYKLAIAEDHRASSFAIEFRPESYAGPPQHHRRVFKAPVNRHPPRLPILEANLLEADYVARGIPVLKELPGENIPRAGDPGLPQDGIDDGLERRDVVLVIAIDEIVR